MDMKMKKILANYGEISVPIDGTWQPISDILDTPKKSADDPKDRFEVTFWVHWQVQATFNQMQKSSTSQFHASNKTIEGF